MSNYSAGHEAEQQAAQYLKTQGYKILDINWRTKYCEVDIVAEKSKRLYFTEVKYRQSVNYGTGFEYITPKKLNQMKFAAEMWVTRHGWEGDYQLAAIEITGPDYEITHFLTEL